MNTITKRAGLVVTVLAMALGLGACSSSDAKDSQEIRFSVWDTGMTGALPKALADDEELQKEFGIDVAVISTPNLPEVYSNVLSDRANANIGAPESFASMREKGAEVSIAGVVARNTMVIVGKADADFTPDSLRGKRLGAITASGAWAVMEARLKDVHGIDVASDMEVVTVPNMLTGAAQVAAGTADYVMGWEPSIQQTLAKYPDFEVLMTTEELEANDSWQFVLGISDQISDENVESLLKALDAVTDKMKADPELADKYGAMQGFTDDTVSRVLAGDSFPVDARPLEDSDLEPLLNDLLTIYANDGLEDEPTADLLRGGGDR